MGLPLPPGLMSTNKEREDIVILGMPGPWAEDNSEASDHYTTKIGGLPDWPIPAEEINLELMKCGVCGGDLGLVAQTYAPLETDRLHIEERTLYIFGCPLPNCGISPLSWRTIRVQKRIPVDGGIFRGSMLGSSSSTDGSMTGIESSNRFSEQEQELNSSTDEWWEDDTWRDSTNGEDSAGTLDMRELGRALLEAGYMAAHLSEGQNEGNHPLVGEASQSEADILDIGLPVLPCFYIYSQNESQPSRGSRALSALHASVDYQAAHNYDAEDAQDGTWEGEEYEHARALSADRTYLKFKKRLDWYPEQCIRYCFGGQPLLANKDQGDPGVCTLCGGPRVYEMQLMPPLLYYLQQACKDSESLYLANNWEWLTLFVYTCAQSCSGTTGDSNEGTEWLVVEEATIIQYET
ncbi:hypothetical protein SUGI_0853490 [Cryptomeria japonica]|uniref:uncharacterized protein LOC131041850 n=1 Tax=Cryptomeria japonica TaxID=3369 RepID=UPI002414AE69|nr:uncharacterized protein LOC131041850 [Cryptomeria japonica]GLJ41232.1 hypothetical protein SUGI_0853490 [Cryptomeria japonica]